MTLEAAIHARWAADADLGALLPVEHFRTGLVRGAGVPCARLVRKACRAALWTSAAATFDEVALEFHVWHDDYDAGRTIVDAVAAAFDRTRFDVSPAERVLDLFRTSERVQQHGDGLWQFTLGFVAQIYRTRS
ncbi:MAG: DUF3168 domain-containing protein [Thermoguttaceae bacterium]|jgi:hypothetical protein|nr:DUF3168 domain-containing protein [Thermoguttaceae bacterium]